MKPRGPKTLLYDLAKEVVVTWALVPDCLGSNPRSPTFWLLARDSVLYAYLVGCAALSLKERNPVRAQKSSVKVSSCYYPLTLL